MTRGVVSTIVRKDLTEFRADRFFLVITALSVVFYPLIFWVLPSTVDETLRVGVVQTGLDPVLDALTESDGIEAVEYASEDELADALTGSQDELVAGLVFPADFLAAAATQEPVQVGLLVTADVPPEVETALDAVASEIVLSVLGEPPPADLLGEPVVLGEDRVDPAGRILHFGQGVEVDRVVVAGDVEGVEDLDLTLDPRVLVPGFVRIGLGPEKCRDDQQQQHRARQDREPAQVGIRGPGLSHKVFSRKGLRG
jgi:hypothetical protein